MAKERNEEAESERGDGVGAPQPATRRSSSRKLLVEYLGASALPDVHANLSSGGMRPRPRGA
eukprot:scaffold61590_cov45-Phaeocystis_antarctica.AAC.1